MNHKELVNKFIKTPSYLKQGKAFLSNLWNVSEDDITEAKAEARAMPKLKLKSRWQSASGEWLESYKVDDNLEDLMNIKDELLRKLESLSYSRVLKGPSKHKDNLLEISIPDYHFGKITGETIDEQKDTFISAVIDVYHKANANEEVSKIVLPIGNDFFNSEATLTTTKGTKQENNTTFYDMFTTGWTAIVAVVDYLSEDVPVDIVVVPGNHDEVATIMLGEVLKAYYIKNEAVTVFNDDEYIKYYAYGNNLFMYTHGDKGKHKDFPLRMAVDQPDLFAKCDYRYIRLGHYHKATSDDQMGIEISVLPSLTPSDKWHRQHNFISKPKITATLFNKKKGKSAVHTIYLEHI